MARALQYSLSRVIMFYIAAILLVISDAYVTMKVKRNLEESKASLDKIYMWGNIQGMLYSFLFFLILAFVK